MQIAVAVLLTLLSSWSKAQANPNVTQIVVVFKTHYDIGYTDLASKVIDRYRTAFVDNAMKVIDASRKRPSNEQFVWTIPGWPLKEMLWAGQTPERRAEIGRALKEGRLVVHGLPFNTEDESMDLEDLVRGMRFSVEIAKEYGLPIPRAAKMTDVPEHTWALETMLKHAGIDFLQIGCNGGSMPMQVPLLFWWQGPDGSRLLTCYSQEYGTQLQPPADWPYHTWLALIMAGDNHGPPAPSVVSDLLKQAATDMPGVKIKFGRLEDFYDAIIAEKDAKIPVVRGDMPDTWLHGLGSMPDATAVGMHARPMETEAGILDTELRAWGLNPPDVSRELATAYENSLLYGEHTFGMHGTEPGGFRYGDDWKNAVFQNKYVRFQESFEDKKDYIRTAATIATNAVDQRMHLLAEHVNVEGPRVVVFNPLPWARDGEVSVDVAAGGWNGLKDLSTKKEVAAVMADGMLRFCATDVPAGGYKTYALTNVGGDVGNKTPFEDAHGKHVGSGNANPQAGEIANQFFRLRVDPVRGSIASLVDVSSRRELVASKDEDGFCEYLHERFSADDVAKFMDAYCRKSVRAKIWAPNDFGKPGMPNLPHAEMRLKNWSLSTEQNAFCQVVTLRCDDAAPLAKRVTIRYTLYDSQPYVDVEWSVEEKTPNPIPEGGWLCFPFAIDKPTFRLGRMGSIIDPATDIIDGGNRRLLCLNSGMTVTGTDGFGVGMCMLDSPLVSLGEPGLWKFSMHYVPEKARVFVNLYNNQWNTNFPLWVQGTWSSRVRLWAIHGSSIPSSGKPGEGEGLLSSKTTDPHPHPLPEYRARGQEDAENLITPSWEAREPLAAVMADGAAGDLPASAVGLTLSQPGVLVTAFGPDPYSDHVLLRLWEQAGKSGECQVRLPMGMAVKVAQPIDLRGEIIGKPINVIDDKFVTPVDAFAPVSFQLQ